MEEFVLEGNHVVLSKCFDSCNMKIVAAERNTVAHYGKLHFDPSPLIGAKFGSIFEIKDNTMNEVKDFHSFDKDLSTTVSFSSATFNEKSHFSQEKLINRRKKQSYSNVVAVMRPTLLLINELLFARDKLGGLRSDTVSQIMTLANTQNGSKCLLLDHNLGILTSAILSRILPDGTLIQLLADTEAVATTRKTISMLNISESSYRDRLLAITIRDLFKVRNGIKTFEYENEILKARSHDRQSYFSGLTNAHSTRDPESGQKTVKADNQKELQKSLLKKDINRELRNSERIKAAAILETKAIDSLILVAQNDHPLPLLKLSWHFLAFSRQFVIYSDILDPLLECHNFLKSNSMAVSLSLTETWFRKYQVLPDRTRPEMNVSGYGGYLLSGTKVHI